MSPDLAGKILRIVDETGDAVVGLLGPDSMRIDMESVAGSSDVAAVVDELGADSKVFVGAFPAANNDGVNVVTMVLPDANGVRRDHHH